MDFQAIFFPNPPIRDSFETRETFRKRTQDFNNTRLQLLESFNQAVKRRDSRVQAGVAVLSKDKYDADAQEFEVDLVAAEWIEKILHTSIHKVAKITVSPQEAESLFKEGQRKPLFLFVKWENEVNRLYYGFIVGLGKVFDLKAVEKQPGQSFQDKLKDGSLGPEMVWIPAGTFQMGSNDGDSDEKPVHTVSLKGFALGKYEVTFEEYDKFCEATGREKPSDSGWGRGKRPVINVTWNDAKAYTQWLSEQTGKDYRLPSEAQWEYACRAGLTGKYSFGDDVNQLGNYGWYNQNSGNKTHPVGEKQPNKFGLYDMHGNVWEWLEDVWHGNYNGAPSDGSAWRTGENSTLHLLRGGSWSSDDSYLSCANRARYNSTNSTDVNYGWGLRISRM